MKHVLGIFAVLFLGLASFAQPPGGQTREVALEPPIPIIKVQAKYTEAARTAKIEGTAMVKMMVNNMGVPEDVSFVTWLQLNVPPDQDRGLRDKAVDAAKQWRFKAAMRNGRPAPMQIHIKINFRLQ